MHYQACVGPADNHAAARYQRLLATGRERLRRRVPTPGNDYRATLADVRGLVVRSERELGVDGSVDIDARRRT